MKTAGWLTVAALALCGCSGARFTELVAPQREDGGDDAPSADPPDSGSGLLDQRTASHEAGALETGEDHDAGTDSATTPEASDVRDAQADVVDAPDGCADDLSNIHGGNFHIDFDVLGVSGGGPLVEQRSACDQYSVHWLIAETASGNLITQFYDGTGGPQIQSVAAVNDGAWHHVTVARVSLAFSITVDGQLDSSAPDAVWSPPALPLLQVGRSACASPFGGQVKNACVARQ